MVPPLPADATFQWLHNGVPIPGATASTFTIASLAASHTGNYDLLVTRDGIGQLSARPLTINVLPLPDSLVDTSFVAELDGSGSARVLALGSDGSIVVAVERQSGDNEIVRLAADGRALSRYVIPAADGKPLIASPTGSAVVTQSPRLFAADGTSLSIALPPGFDSTKPIDAAACLADGKFYLAQKRALARFQPDGSLDPSFNYTDGTLGAFNIQSLHTGPGAELFATGILEAGPPSHSTQIESRRLSADGTLAERLFAPFSLGLFGMHGSLMVRPLTDGRIVQHYSYHGARSMSVFRGTHPTARDWTTEPPFTDDPPVIDPFNNYLYLADARSVRRYHIGLAGLEPDPNFVISRWISTRPGALTVTPENELLVAGSFTEWEGHRSPSLVRLRADAVTVPPVISFNPQISPKLNEPLRLSTAITGTGPFHYEWRTLDGQPAIPDPSLPDLVLPSLTADRLGRYQLRVTGAAGSILSEVIEVHPSRAPRLAALSARAIAGSGDETVIAGITITGSTHLGTPVVVRGAGPALRSAGVTNVLPDPKLEAFQKSALLGENDNWSATPQLLTFTSRVGASPFENGSKDAALFLSLGNGNATFHVSPANSTPGVALMEVYRVPADDPIYEPLGELLNLSFRARTSPDEGTAIAGFVIDDPAGFDRGLRVVLRAIGPTLSIAGVNGALANPVLTVFNQKGAVIAQNDDWAVANSTDPESLAAVMKHLGLSALPAASKDAALLLDLPPGVYTMHASGGTGIVLLEIYTAP